MTHHLGYEKNQSRPGANSRNGYSTKTVITGDGPLELRTPRDRDGTFEPQLVKKNQTRITGMDNQILSLYAKGMTTREIAAAFKELYDADVSPALISKVTDAVMEQVVEWQNRPLDAVYPIVYLDCIVLKVRQDSRSSTNRCSWHWASISKVRKNCWVCGWPKMKGEVLAQCAD
ncbi:Transposase and inactivated derivatives [Klebsiella pneumoniae]|nr:Transposase and inactivated derivatives [Klebsiella pneumoniae]